MPALPRTKRSRPKLITEASIALLLIAAVSLLAASANAQSADITFLPGDRDLSIVAHEDDDLLFLSPEIPVRIQAGDVVRTVFLTAGDAGLGTPYWQNREAGAQAAYAQMAGAANAWTSSDRLFGDKLVRLCTLDGASNVSVVFLRLPDGNVNTGGGYAITGYQSLQRLWQGQISSIASLDGANTYKEEELIQTLVALMMDFRPQHIQTQDSSDLYGNDHPDHRYGARYAFEAHQRYAASGAHHTFAFYRGYNIANEPVNLTQAQRDAKWAVFTTYAQHDSGICDGTGVACLLGGDYDQWSYREYRVAQAKDLAGEVGVLSGGCLTADAAGSELSAPAVISTCQGGGDTSSQTWSINGDGSITTFDGRCLEVRGGVSQDQTPAQLAACAGVPAQRWTAFENGQIRGLAGKCLDVSGGASADGTLVQLSGCVALPEQQWLLPAPSAPPVANPDFSLALAPDSSFASTIRAGGSATYELVLTPFGFAGTVSLTCTSTPPGAACAFSPQPISLDGQNPANTLLTVATTARAMQRPRLFTPGPTPLKIRGPAVLFFMLCLGLAALPFARRRRAFLPLGVALLAVSLWVACGGTSPPPGGGVPPETPAGNYSFLIVATSGNLTRSLTVTLTVN